MPNKKMKISALILMLSGIVHGVLCQSDNRWFIEKGNGQSGFIDSTGAEVFTDDFDVLDRQYKCGLVFFRKEKKEGFLDVHGNVVFTLTGVWGQYSEDLLKFEDDSGFYYLNTSGQKVIDLKSLEMPEGKEVSTIFDFKNGLAMVRVKNTGFDDTVHENGCFGFTENSNLYPGNWFFGFINKAGAWSISPDLESATSFNDSVSIVKRNNETFFLTSQGTFTPLQNKIVGEHSEGYAIEYTDEGDYFIDIKGERINHQPFERANPFSEGLAAVRVDNKWGFIDTTGTIIIEPKYFVRSNFSEGLAPVSLKSDTIGTGGSFIEAFINKNEEPIIPFKSNVDYGQFENGLAKGRLFLYKRKKYTGYYELFYINKKGEKIWSEKVKQ